MMSNLKYTIESLEWQQFEKLAFKSLQIDMSVALTFIEGGSDKGRDFVFNGNNNFFGYGGRDLKYIFQVKHKSFLDSFKKLLEDLVDELNKVFVKNKLEYDVYCLVTNLTISGTQYDQLYETFNKFIASNLKERNLKLVIYSYQNFESCIDKNDFLKWSFPSIVNKVDFKHLIQQLHQNTDLISSEIWSKVFEKNRINFVHTDIFEHALKKLKENNIVLLSGPSKSGKTFTAEMILFFYFSTKSYQIYKIDNLQELNRCYVKSQNQIFLLDDAFGRYNLDDSLADNFDRKLGYLSELTDQTHKFVFTSREYIYKAFLNYSDESNLKFIEKINIEVHLLTIYEKESIFLRYLSYSVPLVENNINNEKLEQIVNHKNFSPETIRAYFTKSISFNFVSILNHLDSPDDYLEKDFKNLNDDKKTVLLATLLSLSGTTVDISYTYNNLCKDLNNYKLVSLHNILNELDGSLLKSEYNVYSFYHPSMFEFFVNFISKDSSINKNSLLKNFNTNLLNAIKFQSSSKKIAININVQDLDLLTLGFKRLLENPTISVTDLNSIMAWLNNIDVQMNLKIRLQSNYNDLVIAISSLIRNIDFSRFYDESISVLGSFFNNIRLYRYDIRIPNKIFENLIEKKRHEEDFWFLVFRITPILSEENTFNWIRRDWFKQFFTECKSELQFLGIELYGDAYPNFASVNEYKRLLLENRVKEARLIKHKQRSDFMQKTNRNWFPRYIRLKDKIRTLKSSHPYGYKLYEVLLPSFAHLQALEDTQEHRYKFNKENGWW